MFNAPAEITKNEDLELGKYYHCFDKNTIAHSIGKCHQDGSGESALKYLGENRIWAMDENNQALERWRIFGPIAPPQIGGIYLCSAHGGHGFQSDCQRCAFLTKTKAL